MTSTPPPNSPFDVIRVRGARTHNLRNIDVDVPRDRLVVITGVSGSGKSSLAFDTLFAEGQRRYLETLSASTRQYLDRMQRPDVDDIDGLPPTLSVEQRTPSVQPRSTLATTTGIHDFLRLLYARAGTLHCHQCGRPVSQQSPQTIVDRILALETGQKAMILAPLVRRRKGKHRELFEKIVRDGFVRARVDGTVVDVTAPPDLAKTKPHDVDVVIDRIVIKDGLRARLQESVELALKHSGGTCLVSHQEQDAWHDSLYSSKFACPDCGLSVPDIEPRTFSFNSPLGACDTCNGLGVIENTEPQSPTSTPAKDRHFAPDALVCPECNGARLGPVARSVRVAGRDIHELAALTVADALRSVVAIPAAMEEEAGRLVAERIAPEIAKRLHYLNRLGVGYLTLDRPIASLSGGEHQRARLAGCLGSGLRGVCYILDEPTIGLHPRDAGRLFETLCELRDQGNSVIVVEHDLDIVRKADAVIDLGPGAGREGGLVVAQGTPAEIQDDPASVTGRYLRDPMRLATNSAAGVSATRRWMTVTGAQARNLLDVTARFPLGALTCVTGVSGSGKSSLIMETLVPLVRRELQARETFGGARTPVESGRIRGLTPPAHPDDPITPPLRKGGQGGAHGSRHASPDSSTPHSLLPPSQSAASRSTGQLDGLEVIDRLVEIDQSPLGRNARSNPATASGIWDEIRRLFARTRDARVRGFRAGRFSFNSAGGRCDECRGLGTRRIGMHFLPDIDVVCPVCRGARFNRQTLEVRFRGKSVADVLDLRIDEALEFFANFASLRRTLATFTEVGLGYLTLGQSAATLSGGEAQRIRLATELSRPVVGPTLYVLDEPTTGLHVADIERLLHLLRGLVDQGHTVIVIEHQLDLIRTAEHVVDLGPEGGAAGGRIVAAGTPSKIAAVSESHTGRALLLGYLTGGAGS